jgi:hypothetical protein
MPSYIKKHRQKERAAHAHEEKLRQKQELTPTELHADVALSPPWICDYTFKTLQENFPKALKSVEISTIRKWEH